jgi:hypothetical protein
LFIYGAEDIQNRLLVLFQFVLKTEVCRLKFPPVLVKGDRNRGIIL